MNSILTLVLASYCFVVQFGNLFRYGSGEGTFGVSTGLAVLIIFLGISKIPNRISSTPVLSGLALLFGWFILSSSLSPTGYIGAYTRLGQLILYLCMAASISSWDFTEKRLKIVVYSMAVGLLFSSGLTIVDYQGWADIPHCNDVSVSTRIEGSTTTWIAQAGGFFPRRSAMAAVYSLSVTLSAIMALTTRNWIEKALFAAAAGIGGLAILLTHNRSAVFAIASALLAYLFFSKSFAFGRRIKVIFLSGVMVIGLFIVASAYFPEHLDVYKRKLPLLFPEASKDYSESQSRSDSVRLQNLKIAFKEIASNPIGNGLGRIRNPDWGYMDSHNNFTSLLWAGGAFTLLWIVPFSLCTFKSLFSNVNMPPDALKYFDAFRFAIFGFFVHNMAHSSLGTGLFWISLAVILSIRHQGIVGLSPMQIYNYHSMAVARQTGSY